MHTVQNPPKIPSNKIKAYTVQKHFENSKINAYFFQLSFRQHIFLLLAPNIHTINQNCRRIFLILNNLLCNVLTDRDTEEIS